MVFDNLITTHSMITYNVSSVEKIYIEQALKLLPTHVLSKIISEGWKIVLYDEVNELIEIDGQLSPNTTGVTKYDLRRVFVLSVTKRNEIAFKSTLIHELVHTYDCILDGSYCNWKTEKYYNNEIENLITQEGSNFSEYARSNVKEYISTVISRYILGQTDFTNIPLTKAFIEKYFYMNENSLEQRLQNLENNAVTYIELDDTYNRLKYSKLNKENDKYVIQLPEASSGSGSSSGSNTVIYDNNVTFSTNVSYFSLNKTTISYITENLDSNTTGTWELTTIMGSSSAIALQYRRFLLNGRDSNVTDFKTLPHEQRRFYDYNISRAWTDWEDIISDIDTRITALESNSGSTGENNGSSRTLIHDYTVNEGSVLNITNLDISTGQFTTDTEFDLSSYTKMTTLVKKEGINILATVDVPKELQNSTNLKITNVIDNTFTLGTATKYSNTGNYNMYGLLVDGIENYTINNIFESNKNYEIEIYTSQPLYYTALILSKCINSFSYSNGYALGGEQFSTYLNALGLGNAEGINFIRHKIKLYNYDNSFKLEVDTIFDGISSNYIKFKYNKFEYFYNGNIMTNFSYQHFRNLIPKGTTIKIYEIGGN